MDLLDPAGSQDPGGSKWVPGSCWVSRSWWLCLITVGPRILLGHMDPGEFQESWWIPLIRMDYRDSGFVVVHLGSVVVGPGSMVFHPGLVVVLVCCFPPAVF